MPKISLLTISLLAAGLLCCRNRDASETKAQEVTASVESPSIQNGKIIECRDKIIITFRPPDPKYPPELKSLGIEGDLRLVFYLDKDGHILQIQKISGPDEFMNVAETYAKQFRFDVDPSFFPQVQSVPFHMTIKFRLPSRSKKQINHG